MDGAVIETLEHRRLLASSGGFAARAGGPFFDSGTTVATAADGSVIQAGLFSGTATFGGGSEQTSLTSISQTDVFVAKYASDGTLQWVRQFGGTEGSFKPYNAVDFPIDPERSGDSVQGPGPYPQGTGQTVGGLAVDTAGNVYFGGSFYGSVTFSAGKNSKTFQSTGAFPGQYPDAYLIKLSSTGSLMWGSQFGGEFTDSIKGIALDASGNPYVTGYFSRTANFNTTGGTFNLTSAGRSDIFAAKYSGVDGSLVWADNMGSDDLHRELRNSGNAIAVDASGNAYLTGVFAATADFDPGPGVFNLTALGGTDAFVEKLDSRGKFVWAERIGGDHDDGGTALALGPGGTIYTLNYFETTVNANPGKGAAKNFQATPQNPGDTPTTSDLLIEKLTGKGQLIWAHQVSGAGWETGGGISVDHGGNVYTTGAFYGPTNFNTRGTPEIITTPLGTQNFNDANDGNRTNAYNIFLNKLSTNGRYIYTRHFGGAGDSYGLGSAMDPSGNVFVTGTFKGTVDFDPLKDKVHHLLDAGFGDAFLSRYDANGLLA